MLTDGFQAGKRLGLMIRNEYANPVYTTTFMCALFKEEGHGFFDVRPAILGHLQQGGDPSPFDRICVEALIQECSQSKNQISFMGMQDGHIQFHDMQDFERMIDANNQRAKEQWWLGLRSIASMLAQHGSSQPQNA
jgi:6-phosphofructokinase 1